MTIFPITPLVRHVQSLILKTFDVSEQEAEDCAAEMVSLAEGWGSPEHAPHLDWPKLIKKNLGSKLKWRSEDERAAFNAERKEAAGANEFLIQKRRPRRLT